MEVAILSLFPDYFESPLNSSILKRALEKRALHIQQVDIRDFAEGRHRQVDDRPYGGGPGMVMMPEPTTKAIQSVRRAGSRVIYLSPQGAPFTAQKARELADEEHVVLLCGHYEGIDQRVLDREVDEELSIGDYVLTNGCLGALVVLDAMVRFLPGVLGHEKAADEDSFEDGLLDCPHYTRPEIFDGQRVPEVLLSGDHGKIEEWRHAEALRKTAEARPELYVFYQMRERFEREPVPSLVGSQGVATIRLPVASLKESLTFYEKTLGLKVSMKREREAALSFANLELVLVQGRTLERVEPQPLFEVAVESNSDFDRIARKALERGEIHFGSRQEELVPWETLTMELRDPDGYHFCLTCKQAKKIGKE